MNPRTLHTTAMLMLLVLCGARQAASAQEVSVRAFVNETTIGTEETLSYTVEIQGGSFSDLAMPDPPETEGLALVYPNPSTQQSVSIINGQSSISVGLEWSYRPLREGIARFLPLEVNVKDRTYHTEAIEVEVVPQAQRPQRRAQGGFARQFQAPPSGQAPDPSDEASSNRITEEDIFIRAVPSARQAYQNEQVIIEYQLFFRSHIQPRNSRLADSWDAEGFWREELDVEARPMPRSTIENGLRYNTIVLKRVAVFPTRNGDLIVDPLRIETEVFAPRMRGDPFGSLFSSLNPFETIERASPPITIMARALPPEAPPTFTGAVGRFEMEARLNRTQVEVGEPVQIQVRISGTGNIALLEGPTLTMPGIFETYDPEITTSINSSGREVRGSKTFTYLLVPRSNGTFELPPLAFSFLDPQTNQYRTLTQNLGTIRVTGTATTPLATSTTASGLPVDDIAPPLTTSQWRRINRAPVHLNSWTYLLLVLPLFFLAGVVVYRRHLTRIAHDAAFARNRKAHPLARKHLKQAGTLLEADQPAAFYEELERAVLGFIGNRLNVAELGMTRPQLDEHLARKGLSDAIRRDLLAFLTACDRGRFSPTRPSQEEMADAFGQAQTLIITLDEAFKNTTEPAAASS